MKKRLLLDIAIASLSLLLLASCDAGSDYTTAGSTSYDTFQTEINDFEGLSNESSEFKVADTAGNETMEKSSSNNDKSSVDSQPKSDVNTGDKSEVKLSNDKIVYRADLEIKTSSFDKSNESLEEMLNRYEAVIQSRNYYIQDNIRICEISLRVPAANFDSMMDETGSIGKVITSNITSENITQQYLDVQSRINSKSLRINRLKELINKADSISELSELYEELENAEYDLDNLKSRLKNMDIDVAYSYINIRLNDTHRYNDNGEEVGTGSWVSNRVYDIWNSLRVFRNFLNGILIIVIYALPYSLLLLLILFIAVKLKAKQKWTELRRNRSNKKAAKKNSIIQIPPNNSDSTNKPDANVMQLTSEMQTDDKESDNGK